MEGIVYTDVGVLSTIFVIVRSVEFGGLGDYYERKGWLYFNARCGSADIPTVFLVVTHEDEWNLPLND